MMVVKTSVAGTSFVEEKSVSYDFMRSSSINLNPFSFAMITPLQKMDVYSVFVRRRSPLNKINEIPSFTL